MRSDLEDRLRRGLRATADDVPPAPYDLADRVRSRARRQRRTRLVATAAAAAAALVLVGVPVAVSGLVAEDRGQPAAPADRPPLDPLPSLYDQPTRGSLAGDTAWLREVAVLGWVPPDLPATAFAELPEVPPDSRRVAFAGDVGDTRVAFVLGPDQRGSLHGAWFTGPPGAAPGGLSLATSVGQLSRTDPISLWAARDDDGAVLVVVGLPGDEARALTGRDVTATGEVTERWEPVPMPGGAGGLALDGPPWPAGLQLEVRRDGRPQPAVAAWTVYPDELVDRPVDVADPRGLRGRVGEELLRSAVESLVGSYRPPTAELAPTLLAAADLGDSPGGGTAVLVGVTFPSGATATALATQWPLVDPVQSSSSELTMTDPAPAGAPLLDRVVAVATGRALAVSGPGTGVRAEVLLADGTVTTTVPLVAGAGVEPYVPPAPATVRVLDASGAVVGEAPVQGG
ncbi:hypothetical protein [Geodermatophilus sp. DSM 44513]|uniref:hypothetical protein n=1 Tax=Geodermatophilus sp. DSM 44513 TaxID=1528104 RepID=UPI00127DEB55|nr:hypothetical protein [Geodermatophilus sp. DSM 44513]WNV75546.1 hypothetical protein RTG05_21610 [Geodermatophilus sp. DSM 44513]